MQEKLKNLESQLVNIKRKIAILEKASQNLEPKLEINIEEPKIEVIPPHNIVTVEFEIKNPTKQPIKMNHIRIDENSPFQFVEAFHSAYNSRYRKSLKTTPNISQKHIDLIAFPITDTIDIDFFSLHGGSTCVWSIKIRPTETENSNKITVPVFILEHTSSNDPYKTLQVRFWPSFFRQKPYQQFSSHFEINH
ncbi:MULTISPECIES: hypothetical protein [unclassified Bartonella]|uniref:hypothetical protein n=2 Tax=Bartonella TaxID=773 RepID=UPI0035D102A3